MKEARLDEVAYGSRAMGDPLVTRTRYLLSLGLYPGDDLHGPIDPDRFGLYRVSENEYAISDSQEREGLEITVPTSLLKKPKFCPAGWYTKKIGEQRGFEPKETLAFRRLHGTNAPSMGTPLADRALQILERNGPYPQDEQDLGMPERFECVRREDGSHDICDYAKVYRVTVPSRLLEKPQFQLAEWYKKWLTWVYEELCDGLVANAPECNVLRLLDWGELTPEE
ncbi:hypothetical protein DFH29DRAFT_802326 [Suillus ampliporus]|nr:hypothetical protein DFH29DRAFT_802326 [Suillus ampliporus]